MKRVLIVLIALGVLLANAAALAQSPTDTLYDRIVSLLEDGDDSIQYNGLGLGIGMDDGQYPAGLVNVDIDTSTGKVLVTHGLDYCIWEHMEVDDCTNSLLILCARWKKLTDTQQDDLLITFWSGERTEDHCLSITTAGDATAFLQAIIENQ